MRISAVQRRIASLIVENHIRSYQINCARKSLKAYKDPERITKTEYREIKQKWGNAGFRGNTDWHRFYKNVNGFDPRYVPTDIYGAELIGKLNCESLIHAWEDKAYYSRLYPNIHKTYTIGYRIDGCFYDDKYNAISIERLADLICQYKRVIIKPSFGLEGRGIETWKPGITKEERKRIIDKLRNYSNNYVVQEYLLQHKLLSQFNSTSVNPIRVMTLRLNNKIVYLHSTLRFGTSNSITDIHFENGKEIVRMTSVEQNGVIGEYFYDINGFKMKTCELGIPTGSVIPNHDKVIEMAMQIHEGLHHFDLIGSDISIDECGNPTMIEFNVFWPGITIPQICNGPLFGEYTEQVLSELEKKKKK